MFGSAFNNNTSSFGTPSNTSFGGSTSFGAQPNQGGMFGSNTNTTGFGSSTTSFGSNNAFGSTQPTSSPFGQQQTGTTFGQTGAFGATNTAFGSNNTFGNTQQNSTAFGATPAGGNVFGSNTGTNNAFGATGNNAFGGSTFGAGGAGQPGTGSVPFNAVKSDTGESFYSITAMPQYQTKTFEELRFEDYKLNRKGGGGGGTNFGGATNTMGGSTFGSNNAFGGTNTNTTGGFGVNNTTNTTQNAFGTPSGSTFGSTPFGGTNTTNQFGSTTNTNQSTGLFGSNTTQNTTGAFGATNTNTGGLFGGGNTAFGQQNTNTFGSTTTPNTSLFGGTNNNTQQNNSGGLFGNTNTTNAFGQTNTNNAFGSNTNTSGGGLFGSNNTTQQNTGLFGGSSNTSGGGLFGSNTNTSGGGLFGSTNNNTNTSGGLFGGSNTTQQNTGLFGSNTTNTSSPFGATNTNTSGGLFGSNTNTTGGGLFGNTNTNTNTSGGLFGSSTNTSSGGLFGSNTNTTSGGLFGSNTSTQNTSGGLFGNTNNTSGGGLFGSNTNTTQANTIQVAQPAPYATGPESQMALHVSLAKRAWKPVENKGPQTTPQLSNKTSSPDKIGEMNTPVSKLKLQKRGYARSYGAMVTASGTPGTDRRTVVKSKTPGGDLSAQVLSPGVFDLNKRLSINKKDRSITTTPKPLLQNHPEEKGEEKLKDIPAVVDLTAAESTTKPNSTQTKITHHQVVSKSVPVLSEEYVKLGYSTTPAMKALREMAEEQLERVEGFEVARKGYGSVRWLGAVDIRDLNIQETIEITHQSVEVYKAPEDTPIVGNKLNRPAIITLENIFEPSDFKQNTEQGTFSDWLKNSLTAELDATFVDYDKQSGVWVFKVEHFTKYAFSYTATTQYNSATTPVAHSTQKSTSSVKALRVHREGVLSEALHTEPKDVESKVQLEETLMETDAVPNNNTIQENTIQTNTAWRAFGVVELTRVERPLPLVLTKALANATPRNVAFVNTENGPTWKLFRQHNIDTKILSRGRRFRVSWGPSGQLAYGGDNGGQVKVFRLQPSTPTATQEIRALQVHKSSCLEQYNTKQHSTEMYIETLHKYMEAEDCTQPLPVESQLTERHHRRMVLTLFNSIYGHTFQPTEHNTTQQHIVQEGHEWFGTFPSNPEASRRQNEINEEALESLKLWFSEVLSQLKKDADRTDPAFFLSIQQSTKACQAAVDAGDVRMALLLAQSESDEMFRDLLKEQLGIWKSEGTPIPEAYSAIYELLSGTTTSETQSHTTGWLRCFGLHLLYSNLPLEPLKNAVRTFRESTWVEGSVHLPTPWYTTQSITDRDEKKVRQKHNLDTLYHLLMLASDNHKYPLSTVLSAQNHSHNSNTVGLNWHLFFLLRGLGLFGNGLDAESESRLTMDYVVQLQICGEWQWAVYVAQFLPAEKNRMQCIQELLNRHVTVNDQAKLSFVRDEVGVCESMINEALAYRAQYNNNINMKLAYLTGAKQWNSWHNTLVTRLVPKLVASGEETILLQIIQAAKSTGLQTSQLKHWELQGGLYELYATLKRTVHTIQNSTGDGVDVVNLVGQLELLRERLVAANTSKDLTINQQTAAEIGTWVSSRLLEVEKALLGASKESVLDIPAWEDRRKTILTHEVMWYFT